MGRKNAPIFYERSLKWGGVTQKTDQKFCERCGKKIPPRLDPRGRKARFCSDACRAAANRKRRADEHQAALEEARVQSMIDLSPPPTWHDRCLDAEKVLRAIADEATDHRGQLSGPSRDVATAAELLVETLRRSRKPRLSFNDVAPMAPMRSSSKRKKKKKRRR